MFVVSSNICCDEAVVLKLEDLEDPKGDADEVSEVEILLAKVLFSVDKDAFVTVVVSETEEPLLHVMEDDECCCTSCLPVKVSD